MNEVLSAWIAVLAIPLAALVLAVFEWLGLM